MADWKVSAERITVFDHPDPEVTRLKVARVGMFPLVVGADNGYIDDQIVVFAPKRSVLPAEMHEFFRNADTGKSYLRGPNGDRVGGIRLRGEISEGVTIPMDYVLTALGLGSPNELPIGEDLSERLGITEFVPAVPMNMAGKTGNLGLSHTNHDVEGLTVHRREFVDGEMVVITEKLHGSQIAIMSVPDVGGPRRVISSKGLFKKDFEILDEPGNLYWEAARETDVFARLEAEFPDSAIQAFGEAIPAQKGFTYGQDRPTLRLFRIEVDGVRLFRPFSLSDLWVPVLDIVGFDIASIDGFARGMETVSGKCLHIREGVVIEPVIPRAAHRGWPLYLKAINPKFKDDDEAFS